MLLFKFPLATVNKQTWIFSSSLELQAVMPPLLTIPKQQEGTQLLYSTTITTSFCSTWSFCQFTQADFCYLLQREQKDLQRQKGHRVDKKTIVNYNTYGTLFPLGTSHFSYSILCWETKHISLITCNLILTQVHFFLLPQLKLVSK